MNITNYFDHPTRPGHTIFRFYEKERALLFEEFLNKDGIWYETDIVENEPNKTAYFYGVKNADIKAAQKKNYLVSAKFRKTLIPNLTLRYILFTVTFMLVLLAIIGYIKS